MNLLIFIHSLSSGGAERVAVNLANLWATKSGWQVTVVTLAPTSMDFYELHPAIRRLSLDLTSESSNTVVGMVQNLRRIFALRSVLREIQPDVALAMMSTANVLLALAALGMSNLVTLGSERIHPPQLPLGWLWGKLRRLVYGYLAAVVALTSESAAWLKENTNSRNVPIIPNAVSIPLPIQDPILDTEQLLPVGKKMLLAVGRLDHQKGFDMLIEAFALLICEHPDWVLVILGEGAGRLQLETQARSAGLEERILLPGRVGNVGQWYELANIYVMSSRFEGFPNTLIEAMAYGLPSVSFDCDTGPRDIVRHEKNGFLVPLNDVDTLVKTLDSLMGSRSLRLQYGKQALEVKERFSLEKIACLWEALFEKLRK